MQDDQDEMQDDQDEMQDVQDEMQDDQDEMQVGPEPEPAAGTQDGFHAGIVENAQCLTLTPRNLSIHRFRPILRSVH